MAADVQAPLPGTPSQTTYTISKTKALPKHTLFGSALQQLDDEDRKQLSHIDVSSPPKQPRPGLEKHKQELDTRKLAQQLACSNLKTAKENAMGFQPSTARTSSTNQASPTARAHQWYKPEDLNHASEINRVGLNSRQSYNYDKYRTKPPVHKYALIGDLMRPGSMDFPMRDTKETAKTSMNWSTGANPSQMMRAQSAVPTSSTKACVVNLPVNIKHFYGSKVCDSLLSDQAVVDETLAQQKRDKEVLARASIRRNVSALKPDICPSYESLGNSSRQNIFPGYSINHKKSLAKSTYTEDVHQRRVAPPDEYRYQRDELSVWSQHNFLLSRLKKKWNDYILNLPKASVNWDRSVKRDVVVAPPPAKPQKIPKRKKKPVTPPEAQPAFEDFIFETPPITPPPPPKQPSPVKVPDYVRDDEFWEFFDQSVP